MLDVAVVGRRVGDWAYYGGAVGEGRAGIWWLDVWYSILAGGALRLRLRSWRWRRLGRWRLG